MATVTVYDDDGEAKRPYSRHNSGGDYDFSGEEDNHSYEEEGVERMLETTSTVAIATPITVSNHDVRMRREKLERFGETHT